MNKSRVAIVVLVFGVLAACAGLVFCFGIVGLFYDYTPFAALPPEAKQALDKVEDFRLTTEFSMPRKQETQGTSMNCGVFALM